MSNSLSRKLERSHRMKRTQEIRKSLRHGVEERQRAVDLACEYIKSFGCFPVVYHSGDDFVRVSYCCEHGIQIDGVLILVKSDNWRWTETESTSYPCDICKVTPYDDEQGKQFYYES